MTGQPGALTRQQLYDRIRAASKDEVVLDEMIRLGFGPSDGSRPTVPEALLRRRGEIDREIAGLVAAEGRWADPQAALEEIHRRRKKAARERRGETRRRRAEERHARALAWHARRSNEVLYLGEGVSAGLRPDPAAPAAPRPGLPDLPTPRALAEAMGVPLAELRFLAYDRALARIGHYRRFTIPKKAGGLRTISAPMPRLKRVQYWILDNLLGPVPVHEAAHGFVPGRSIVTNAAVHVRRDVVVNLDLKDFFPTLTFRRVKGKFRGLGYAEPVATVLALLCTEPDAEAVEIDGERLFAARGPRRLPQGAPTSPLLTNLICTRLDARLAGLAGSLGFAYTRYADDMTFSGAAAGKVGALLGLVGEIVAAEGFCVHPDKTRVMRRGSRQEVTGLTVNQGVAVPREVLRRFRALLHQIDATGPAGKRWGQARDVMDAAHGFSGFVHMVTPAIGAPLVATVRRLRERHGLGVPAPAPSTFRARSAVGAAPLPRWWTPASPPPPEPEPILLPPEPATPPAPRSALPFDRSPAVPTPDPDDAPAVKPWVAVLGVFVLANAAAAIHPALGVLVPVVALVVALTRRRRRR